MCKIFQCFFSLYLASLLKCIFAHNFEMLSVPMEVRKHFERTARHIPSPKVHRCGEVGQDMVVNFVNTNYPTDDIIAGDCKFRMHITSQHICQIRVDFVDTELMDPVRGECLSQFFIVQGDIWPTGLPPLCGINNDQHFYLHLEPWYNNASVVDFNLVTVVRGRPYRFGVWLTQIDCSSFNVLKAPEGCTQYYLAENGTIKSFNYEGYRYLNSQNYQVCIRPVKGTCGMEYEAEDGDFSMKKSITATRDIMQRSGVGPAICGSDYVLIPEGREGLESVRRQRLLFNRRRRPAAQPAPPPPARKRPEVISSADRYCGTYLSPSGGEKQNRPVFARVRSNLAFLRVRTTPLQEEKGAIEALNLTAGFRISYTQIKECAIYDVDLAIPHSVKAILDTVGWTASGEISKREPSSESTEDTLLSNGSNGTTEPIKDIPEDDTLWDYLDMHTEDKDHEEKDLYDF